MILSTLVRWKVYIDRARLYMGYAQLIAMLLVMLKVYDDTRFGAWFFSHWWAFLGFLIVFFALSVVIGYLDKRYIRPIEQGELNKTNTILMEIHKKIVG